jgi:hypothetical protein
MSIFNNFVSNFYDLDKITLLIHRRSYFNWLFLYNKIYKFFIDKLIIDVGIFTS